MCQYYSDVSNLSFVEHQETGHKLRIMGKDILNAEIIFNILLFERQGIRVL